MKKVAAIDKFTSVSGCDCKLRLIGRITGGDVIAYSLSCSAIGDCGNPSRRLREGLPLLSTIWCGNTEQIPCECVLISYATS